MGEIERHITQVIHLKSQIDAGALGTAMAQQIADRLKGGSLPQQVHGERVSQTMRTMEWNGQAAAPRPGLKCLGNCGGLQRALRRTHSEKNLPSRQGGATVPQVVDDGCADVLRQR